MTNNRDIEADIEEHQTMSAKKLGNIASRFVETGLSALVGILQEEWQREVTIEEAADFLNAHSELLSFELLDSAISQDWKVRAMVNTATSVAGWVLRQHDAWANEIREKGGELILEMARQYRPDVYKVFKERPNLINFFAGYIIYKFGI